mgnify:CR=1 FL=1
MMACGEMGLYKDGGTCNLEDTGFFHIKSIP